MKNPVDYSQYKCPYSLLKKKCGHELKGPEGYEDVYGVWCDCGFRGPVFYLDPDELGLERKEKVEREMTAEEEMQRLRGEWPFNTKPYLEFLSDIDCDPIIKMEYQMKVIMCQWYVSMIEDGTNPNENWLKEEYIKIGFKA